MLSPPDCTCTGYIPAFSGVMALAIGLFIGVLIGLIAGLSIGKRRLQMSAETLEMNLDGITYQLYPRHRRKGDPDPKKVTHGEWRARHKKRRSDDRPG